jgi:DNA-nicking Smr family endonuclease
MAFRRSGDDVRGTDDDIEYFFREMAGVERLKATDRTQLVSKPEQTPGQRYRRDAAQRAMARDDNFLTTAFVDLVHPQAVLSFMRPGIQHGVFRKLRQGSYPVDAVLDLHQLTVEQARNEVYRFIHDCMALDVRSALINHGKGGRDPDRPAALLKSYVAKWLPQFSQVMAFHSAQGFHGGTGAVYVLLRKSERQKQRTRRRLGLVDAKPDF